MKKLVNLGSEKTPPVNQRKAKLNDENEIPVIGLGTFLSAPNEVTHAVVIAWLCGVRHFDCAQFYQNEEEVGAALKLLSQRPDFRREDIFITSKAWNSHHRPENIKKALDQSLRDLGTTYLDLYLIHWTVNFSAIEYKDSPTGIKLEPHEDGTMLLDKELSLTDTWRTMIELRSTGKVKSIGVSNFRPNQIQKLIDETGVTPAVSQVEAHPYPIQRWASPGTSAEPILSILKTMEQKERFSRPTSYPTYPSNLSISPVSIERG